MASGQPNTAPAPAVDPPRLKRIARDVIAHIRRNPIQNVTIILALVTAVVGMGVGLRVYSPKPAPSNRHASGTLAEALAALDADDRETARSIAADLRLVADLPKDEIGGPAYVLGVAMAQDAEEEWNESERRIRFLLAARYLEEAKESGFPPGRHEHGLFALGNSLYGAGQYAQSLPIFHEALDVDFSRRTEILGLLAKAYLRDAKPRYDKALEFNREYLADDALSFDDRYDALMMQGDIMFGQGDFADCEAAISAIPETSPHFASALLLRGRLLLRQGEQLAEQAGDMPAAAQAIQNFENARELFRLAQVHNPTDVKLGRQAQYLTGLTYRRTAPLRPTDAEESVDLRAALEQFGRTRRSHFDTAEGISASLEEAEIHQLLEDDEAAIKAYRQTLRFVADAPAYNNPWVSPDEMRSRVEASYTAYRDAGQFDYATQLAAATALVFSQSHAIQLQAEAREAAARKLAADAEGLPLSQAQSLLVDSRTQNRHAGALYAQLAKLRFTSRNYPDDLQKSAENYLRGQDYVRAVRYFTQFLGTQNRAGRPPALTALGEAMLALHKPEKALPYLTECVQYYPRDPHSYRARVIAAQAQQELGNLGQARALLEANLEHESLSPRSIEWRESLFALGELLYLDGVDQETQSRLEGVATDLPTSRKTAFKFLEMSHKSFHEAIAHLDEAVKRDPDARQAIEARYRIAESYRHAAKLPRRKLDAVTIDPTRKKLTEELNNELAAAESGYRELIGLLNTKQEQSELSGIEQRILRNCYFARADALYDWKRYEDAIQAYSNATNRYQQEPESLEAYVQIANCHRRRNRPAEYRGTLEQAKVILERIRPDADFLQTTRYTRDEWEKFLDGLGSL
ncbi:MAG: tetratricopeptide repeat protein [Planctomycetota bacterium]|nr:tetratricopeptide repeat protein [Planctomycetota bacterium]